MLQEIPRLVADADTCAFISWQLTTEVTERHGSHQAQAMGDRELLKQYREFGDTFSESHVCSWDLSSDLKVHSLFLDLMRIVNRI